MSAYKNAIGMTLKTIEKRAKNYRNLIALVVIVGIGSISSAILSWKFFPIVGVLFIFPICGFFFFLDSRQLNKWRSTLFTSWIRKELDFWAFRDAIRVHPHLPKLTLQGMIETLPTSPDWAMEQAASGRTREVVVWMIDIINADRTNTLKVKVFVSVIVVVALFSTVILGNWYPIGLITLIAPLQLWMKMKRRELLYKLHGLVNAARLDHEFNEEVFRDLIEHIDWRGIALSEKKLVTDSILQ